MRQRRPAPWWCVALVAAAFALLIRAFDGSEIFTSTQADDYAPPALAFFGFLVTVAGWILTGLQVAGQAAIAALTWSVQALWAFAVASFNALKAGGALLLTGAKKTLGLLKLLYRDVLKPAWTKFWKFVDQVRDWVERKFKPLFDFLFALRKRILEFYTKWVRPILDVIGIARKVLRVLQTFGIDWARALDKKLAELERRIDEPFRRVLAEVNKIINLVNRVVTADELFQRLALVRSIERDIRQVSRAVANWRSKPETEAEWEERRTRVNDRTPAQVQQDFDAAVATGGGRYSAVIAEIAAKWRVSLERVG